MTGDKTGYSMVIPRVTLSTRDTEDLSFIVHWALLLVRLAFVVIVNQSE